MNKRDEMANEHSKISEAHDTSSHLGAYRSGLQEGFLAGFDAAIEEVRKEIERKNWDFETIDIYREMHEFLDSLTEGEK
jgi:hypothetical protein